MARKKGPQAQQAYEYIKGKIQDLEFAPGAAVSDHSLEQILDMSRSPIREAIMRLVSEGLIEFKGHGAQVTRITLQDIIEICQVRRAVEVASVQILMENGGPTEAQKEQLTECFCHMESSLEPVENYFYDDQFHDLIMTMSGNRRLLEISNMMRAQICRARWLNCMRPDRIREAGEEHAVIYDALMADDAERSVEAMRFHLDQSEKHFRRALSGTQDNEQILASVPEIIKRAKQKLGSLDSPPGACGDEKA